MQGFVGTRLITYSTQLPPTAIEWLLGHDPRSRNWRKLPDDIEAIYNKIQRATSVQRLLSVADYIRYWFMPKAALLGAFPAVSIAVQHHIGFAEIDQDNLPGVGHIQIDMSSRNARVIVDGLGRLSATLNLIEDSYDESRSEEERDKLRILLEHFTIPVVLFASNPETPALSRDEMGQLFFDFNFKAVPVPPRIAIALDKSDPYTQMTNLLARECVAISENGGMEERAASLGKKSTALVVQQILLRFVRGAMEGASFQESNRAALDNPNLTQENIGVNVENVCRFLSAFADAMGERFSQERKSLHISAPGWQALGVIYNDLVHVLDVPDPIATAKRLGSLNWARDGALWSDLVVEREAKDGGTELVLSTAGATAKREMVKILRRELGINEMLEAASQAAD